MSGVLVEKGCKTPVLVSILRGGEREVCVAVKGAFSPSNPNEVRWEILERSKYVCVGDVYIEVAKSVVGYSSDKGKFIVYRPTKPVVARNPLGVVDVAKNSDIFVVSGWAVDRGIIPPPERFLGNKTRAVVLVDAGGVVRLYTPGEALKLSLKVRRRVDPTGATDLLVALLLKGWDEGLSWETNLKNAVKLASKTVERLGSYGAIVEALKS